MRLYFLVFAIILLFNSAADAQKTVAFKGMRHFYIEGFEDYVPGADPRHITGALSTQAWMVDFLIRRLKKAGFTVESSKQAAEAILVVERRDSPNYPQVFMSVLSLDDHLLWSGKSTYHRWTIFTWSDPWTADYSALANGITKELLKAMKKSR